MKYQAVIYDLDGVLCHTDQYHYLAWKKIADELGIPFNEEINNRLRGVSRMDSLDIILETYSGKLSEEQKLFYANKKNGYYRQYLELMSTHDLDPGIKSVLDQMKAKQIKQGIGSSSKNTKFILKQIGLQHYFDAVSDGTNITRSKPDPEVYLKASAFLGIPPKQCLVVEDAKSGIEAAIAANMDCAAVGDGTRYRLATYQLEHFSDLLRIVIEGKFKLC